MYFNQVFFPLLLKHRKSRNKSSSCLLSAEVNKRHSATHTIKIHCNKHFCFAMAVPLFGRKNILRKTYFQLTILRMSKTYKTLKVDVIYWDIRNLFGVEIRIVKHQSKLQECVRFRKKVRFAFEIIWRNVLEWKKNLIVRAVSSVRARCLVQLPAFVLKVLRDWARSCALTDDIERKIKIYFLNI